MEKIKEKMLFYQYPIKRDALDYCCIIGFEGKEVGSDQEIKGLIRTPKKSISGLAYSVEGITKKIEEKAEEAKEELLERVKEVIAESNNNGFGIGGKLIKKISFFLPTVEYVMDIQLEQLVVLLTQHIK
jgi:hypothetical protein